MKGTASHLLEFLEGARKRFIIPVYQRNYDWKRENCKQLFDDLVSVVKEGKNRVSPKTQLQVYPLKHTIS
ncbi:DUF262 domain-containing protein [Prevotella multiformis]|uniref:GmrSD restriction endonuclease domain-containing protein n=1 Tax=Prevotella multiformis TaxID=282402 RepID=UPI001BA89C6A|nr:DUF262 domain-containing protein [Prevotella multiformis]